MFSLLQFQQSTQFSSKQQILTPFHPVRRSAKTFRMSELAGHFLFCTVTAPLH